jgi:hypothetical protein
MTYQNVQKNELYLFMSESCIYKQIWNLFIIEEQFEPLFQYGENSNVIIFMHLNSI